MYNYNTTQDSLYDPTKLGIYSIFRPELDFMSISGDNFKKTVSLDDIVHFINEENIVACVDFDCGFTVYPEATTEVRQIDRERKNHFQILWKTQMHSKWWS